MSDGSSPQKESQRESESPRASKTRREGNESLWKRARRTLGTSSLTFLEPQSRPAGSTTGSGPAPPNKRREQVRHAQRTHRQRTQNYIKTLESEVVRLREGESKFLEEQDRLQGQIESLKGVIIAANLPLPPTIPETRHDGSAQDDPFVDFSLPATVSYSTDNLAHERLQVTWPNRTTTSLQDSSQVEASTMPSFETAPAFGAIPDLSHDFSNLQPPSLTTDAPSPLYVSSDATFFQPTPEKRYGISLDTMEIAVDFVLALEYPCMQHIPWPGNTGKADPANHMMMMSTPLMARAPESPRPDSAWQANASIIKELLNLSSSINLEGEITPIEAWHRLHQHPDFWKLDRQAIEKLKRDLSGEVRCCGFGAVLDEQVFWQSYHRLLAITSPQTRR